MKATKPHRKKLCPQDMQAALMPIRWQIDVSAADQGLKCMQNTKQNKVK